MKRHRVMAGFTIIELMVVVLVAAILLAAAVPSFNTLLINNRSAAQSRTFFDALNYARAEAVKRATAVRVTSLNGASWQGGWLVWIDTNNNGGYDGSPLDLALQTFPKFSGTATLTGTDSAAAAITELIFNAQGGVASAATFPVTFHYSPGSQYCQDIVVSQVGRVYITGRGVSCP